MKKRLAEIILLVALIGVGAWFFLRPRTDQTGFIKGNGRIEATEIDVATKIAGRVRDVLVDEGDFVEAGQVLANIQSDSLQAQLAEAKAQHRQALDAVTSAQAATAARKSDKAAAQAVVLARQAEATARKQRLGRTETLTKQKVLEQQ
jgi:multidrug resistance efflux pump